MKYSKEGREYDWKIALGIFALNFIVVQYVLGVDGTLDTTLVFAFSAAVFSILMAGGFLYFVIPDNESTKVEKRKSGNAIQILGVLSLFSAVIAFGALVFAINTMAFCVYVFGFMVVVGFGLWHVDSD